MTLKADLRPTRHDRVIDLVAAAGVDVSDWANFAGGAAKAATNPKYCYEWAFVDPKAGVVVLNLWHHNILEARGRVTLTTNLRKVNDTIKAERGNAMRARRAASFDNAVRNAHEGKMLVRAILNEGDRDRDDDSAIKTDVVRFRALDPLAWSVKSYDVRTGDTILVRNDLKLSTKDQFEVGPLADSPTDRIAVSGFAYVRDAAVRAAVLRRANGRCEYCGEPGFLLTDGNLFLETHHIVPLSENGRDTVANVAAVCANHHREAHHGVSAGAIRERLLAVAANAGARR